MAPWTETRSSASISEVLEKCLAKPQAQWTRADKIRAARRLRAQGSQRYRERLGNRLEWRDRKEGAFLLRTQFPDGSWYVRGRSPKFQPYFQSGFPFDQDQRISSAGTAWAVMALSHAVTLPR